MEKKGHVLLESMLWVTVLIQLAMTAKASNITTTEAPSEENTEEPEIKGYAWSAWGSWSPCSRTCGGGVSQQERYCLPRFALGNLDLVLKPREQYFFLDEESRPASLNSTLPTPLITVRVTRQVQSGDCLGVDKRYHECNTHPCPGGILNTRAEQCAAYDRRPFRGRFYTWIPYIDGDSPCMLNCRPLGQHFYASLALVADGTSCTKPGFRAICIQGTCKVVGRESVLAGNGAHEMRCGRRLVSGLFTRPRLPLGYSYVTTVPRGACRLNVSEINASENYIALRISNNSYIMNGEFAVSAPGTYEAAGARFLYTRAAGLDNVYAYGPLRSSIDIMILYTQPNPSIKYEYFTEASSDEEETVTARDLLDVPSTAATKHIRRHHNLDAYPRPSERPNFSKYPDLTSMSKSSGSSENGVDENVVGNRKFLWKILSFTQCTRSCGGGIQLGKYRCVESSANGIDREVSSVHCTGSAPVGKRRRCSNVPCPPRWRAAAWSACPRCGLVNRTRIVGCVQDHSRGITKISDQKCPPPKPTTVEQCNIPRCDEINTGQVRHIEQKRVKPREHTDTFREGPVYTVSINSSDIDVTQKYSFSAAGGWLYTEWSECVGWCVGNGVQTRSIRCADPSGCDVKKEPESLRICTPKLSCELLDGEWFTGEWSRCSSKCKGKQVRGVLCIGGTGRHLRNNACKSPKPEHERECGTECPPTWYFSDWNQCTGNCTSKIGLQRRTVVCMHGDATVGDGDANCGQLKPIAQRPCELQCSSVSPLPPDLTIESQRKEGFENTSTQTSIARHNGSKGCEDKLNNCFLAVQARLCHYNYYVHNCCNSCRGR